MSKNVIVIPCPLCGASDAQQLYKINGWQLVQCASCTLVYVNPRPPADIIERGFHATNSRPSEATADTPFNLTDTYSAYYADEHYQKHPRFSRTLDHLLKLSQRPPAACRILDFGCGNGAFLEQALTLGMDAYGCDIADWTRPFIEQKGLTSRVYLGQLADAPYQDASFDIIHANGVICQAYDPQIMVKLLKQKLKPQGILALMGTPNIESVFARLKIDSFDGNVPLLNLNFFSKKTLLFLLQQQGFQPIYMRTHGVPLRLVAPPYFPKFLRKTSGYYQSTAELSIDHWHDTVGQSSSATWLKKLHLYEGFKAACNALLNMIDGGVVIDVIARKSAEN